MGWGGELSPILFRQGEKSARKMCDPSAWHHYEPIRGDGKCPRGGKRYTHRQVGGERDTDIRIKERKKARKEEREL